MDLYQASLEQNGKKFESHSNALEEADAEENNALVMYNSNFPINTKGLKNFNFFRTQMRRLVILLVVV